MINLRGTSVLALAVTAWITAVMWSRAYPRDDGRYAASPLRSWFDSLTDRAGRSCCSTSDGIPLEDLDWIVVAGTANPGVHYRVRVSGVWEDVPDEAVVYEPNKAGRPMLWMVHIVNGPWEIRCFLPGNLS